MGTGCASLPETIALSRYAIERGVDAILVAPPFFFKGVPDTGLLAYYRAVCSALPDDARVLLYHIPQVTMVSITPAVVEGLLESHPQQVFGIKDSSGDAATFATFTQYQGLRLYGGNEAIADNAMKLGAYGLISAFANLLPGLVRAVYDAHITGGDTSTAQARLNALVKLIPGNTPPALKAAMPWITGLPRT
ncbi:MAG: dihydrodipicolinate synthase family protein, partial [Chloroflexaceae bacterium]|nr:dihydrodipicolinate synthase family protein [Chloroflexaceae bacterium]